MTRCKLGSLVLATVVCGAPVAVAEGPYWNAEPFTQSFDQKGKTAADFTYSGIRINSVNPDVPEIRFGCSERFGLTATITFLPASQSDPLKSQHVKLRQRTTMLKIEGRDRESVPWTVVKETRTIQTRYSRHAAMIYNAIVQQLPFTITEPYKGKTTITPPPMDDDFKQFAKSCHVTSG